MKKQILLFAAICAGAMSFGASDSFAREGRISVHEVRTFMTSLSSAINNPNINSGRSFLNANVANRASFQDTIFHDWQNPHGAYTVNGYAYGSPYYYRYPYAANTYNRTSNYAMTKTDIINRFEDKKRTIPGYAHNLDVLSVNMDATATQAVADVVVREFGAYYSPAAYYGGGQHRISESRCKASLVKDNRGDLVMTGMNCNTTGAYPLL